MTNKSELMGWPHYKTLVISLFKREDKIKDLLESIPRKCVRSLDMWLFGYT